jgi:GxxExxY protein
MDSTTLLTFLIEVTKDIFNTLGPGYNEVIYHNAFEVGLRTHQSLKSMNIKYQSEVVTPIMYNGYNIGHGKIDLIVSDSNGRNIIIELKAINTFTNETANTQIKNYMKHYSISEGLIINFGQSTKVNPAGELSIKYILKEPVINNNTPYRIFNFINDIFVEYTNAQIMNIN